MVHIGNNNNSHYTTMASKYVSVIFYLEILLPIYVHYVYYDYNMDL